MAASTKITVIKCLTVAFISFLTLIVYVSSQPTSDESIIKAAEDACVFEKRMQRSEAHINRCLLRTNATKIADVNECYESGYSHGGISYYTNGDDMRPRIRSTEYDTYIANKRIGALIPKSGEPYKPNCTIW